MKSSIRTILAKGGVAMLLTDILLYAIGCAHLQLMINENRPLQQTLESGARYCVIGSSIALVLIPFLLFAHGWKRVPLIAAALILIPLFVGLTLY